MPLTPEGLARSAARMLISSFVAQGMGSNAIQNQLITLGYGYRRTTMLADIRYIRGLPQQESVVRKQPLDQIFCKDRMSEQDLTQDRKYRIHYEVDAYNRATGEVFTVRRSMYSDTWRSPEEWIDEFWAKYGREQYDASMNILGFSVVNVEHNKDYRY